MSSASHDLPGILGEIADLVGIEAALAVAEKVGGGRAYIPRRLPPEHWLVHTVGLEKAAIISEYFATGTLGIELDFPVGSKGSYNRERQARARRLGELVARGLSVKQIAKEAGMTRRGVQMFRARQRRAEAGEDDAPTFDF